MRQLELGPAEFERDEAARGLVEDFNAGDTPKLKSYTARSRCTTPHMTSAAMPSRAAYCSTPPASMIAATVGVWAMYVGIST